MNTFKRSTSEQRLRKSINNNKIHYSSEKSLTKINRLSSGEYKNSMYKHKNPYANNTISYKYDKTDYSNKLKLPQINNKTTFYKYNDNDNKSFIEEREMVVNEIFKESDIQSSSYSSSNKELI
jgi:hypothetical protein